MSPPISESQGPLWAVVFSIPAGYLWKSSLFVTCSKCPSSTEMESFLITEWTGEWPAGTSCPPRGGCGGPGVWVRRSSTSALYVTSNSKVPAGSLIPFAVTWMTGYSGQEKIALTSCDSGKVNHIGTWPLNTQGAGSNLRGWLGAPLSSLVISWLLSWTSCPSFSDKLCLKEWWAVCH